MKLSVPAVVSLSAAVTQACLLPSEIEAERELRVNGVAPRAARVEAGFTKRQSNSVAPIGDGNRFEDGTVPVGLGSEDKDLESVLNIAEHNSALKALAAKYDSLKLFDTPNPTYENNSIHGASFGEEPRVFIMSGIHARERGGPDTVIYFLADLLQAQADGTGLTYGDVSYTAEQVQTAVSAGLVVLPCVNPDGVAYDQKTDSCWRKNRNPESSTSGGLDVGVDLNRNFDFLFDYKKYFNLDADLDSAASDDPRSEIFHGTSGASEPETKDIVWALDQFPTISWFMDLHSFAGDILYAWGDDNLQTTDPEQNFVNPEYDGLRGFVGEDPSDSVFREYLAPEDEETQVTVTNAMQKSMNAAGNVDYISMETVSLYPTSGASTDYAHGRFYGGDCSGVGGKMMGLTVEFGAGSNSDPSCPFYTTLSEYHNHIRQVSSGFMEMLIAAAGPAGEPQYIDCQA